MWIFRGETAILRKNGGFSGLLSYSRKTTYFRKNGGFSNRKPTVLLKCAGHGTVLAGESPVTGIYRQV